VDISAGSPKPPDHGLRWRRLRAFALVFVVSYALLLYETGGIDPERPFLQLLIALISGAAAYFYKTITTPGKFNWDWGYRKEDPPQ
jgi:hypothetical protein